MPNLTSFGLFHTLLSLAAVALGIVSFARQGAISPRTKAGVGYIGFTVASCVTGLFLFHHGGFGAPHALAVLTLLVLLVGFIAGQPRFAGGFGGYVEMLSYSLTFFFHMIPGLTETFTRLPASSPLFTGPEDPRLKATLGVVFVVFLAGVFLQVRRLRAARRELGILVDVR
ncbi:MAG TPA: hypothetical protein DDZ67_07910 [Xanthomonadaceae bacterium]|nr:hypothetical protein [Xanthomonadaceae bacterium]